MIYKYAVNNELKSQGFISKKTPMQRKMPTLVQLTDAFACVLLINIQIYLLHVTLYSSDIIKYTNSWMMMFKFLKSSIFFFIFIRDTLRLVGSFMSTVELIELVKTVIATWWTYRYNGHMNTVCTIPQLLCLHFISFLHGIMNLGKQYWFLSWILFHNKYW